MWKPWMENQKLKETITKLGGNFIGFIFILTITLFIFLIDLVLFHNFLWLLHWLWKDHIYWILFYFLIIFFKLLLKEATFHANYNCYQNNLGNSFLTI